MSLAKPPVHNTQYIYYTPYKSIECITFVECLRFQLSLIPLVLYHRIRKETIQYRNTYSRYIKRQQILLPFRVVNGYYLYLRCFTVVLSAALARNISKGVQELSAGRHSLSP